MPSDFLKASAKVSKLDDRIEDEQEKATKESMGDLQNSVRNELIKGDSVARKVLIQDIREKQATGYDVQTARTVTMPFFAKYLEYGTGQRARRDTLPNHENYKGPDPMPPYQAILDWVVAKNVTSQKYGQYELAEAIQQRIGEVGTFPHPFARPAWFGSRGYQNVIQANKNALSRAVRRTF